ncbi:hypothetical protein JTM51_37060, partial [Pseudomonas aeruginosa]|nr:hypothetical protein [Pseudomonas aeruginosa]
PQPSGFIPPHRDFTKTQPALCAQAAVSHGWRSFLFTIAITLEAFPLQSLISCQAYFAAHRSFLLWPSVDCREIHHGADL